MGALIGKLFSLIWDILGWALDLLGKALRGLGELLVPVRLAIVRITGHAVAFVGEPIVHICEQIEELEVLGAVLLLVIAVFCALLAALFMWLTYRKVPPKEDPSFHIGVKIVLIALGMVWLAYTCSDHSATEGIMNSINIGYGEKGAIHSFESWSFFQQFDLWILFLIFLPVFITDCVMKMRWGAAPAMILGAVAGLALGRFVYLVIYFLLEIAPLIAILLYPLEGLTFTIFIPLLFGLIPYQLMDDFEGIAKDHETRKRKQQQAFEVREKSVGRAERSASRRRGSFESLMMSHFASSIPDTIHGPNGMLYHKKYTMGDYAVFRNDAGESIQINDADIGYSGKDASNSFGYFHW